MGTSALSDMYAQSPRAAGPRPEGIRIRQSTSVHVKTNMLHFQHSKICPKLDVDTSICLYSFLRTKYCAYAPLSQATSECKLAYI